MARYALLSVVFVVACAPEPDRVWDEDWDLNDEAMYSTSADTTNQNQELDYQDCYDECMSALYLQLFRDHVGVTECRLAYGSSVTLDVCFAQTCEAGCEVDPSGYTSDYSR